MLNGYAGFDSMTWLQANESLIWWLGVASLFLFVATLALVPMVVVRIPADYFAKPHREDREVWPKRLAVVHLLLVIAKNLLGLILVLVGFALLFLPGQGLFTMVVGLLLMNFPGKYRIERWLVSFPTILPTINRIRTWRGHEPLVIRDMKPRGTRGNRGK